MCTCGDNIENKGRKPPFSKQVQVSTLPNIDARVEATIQLVPLQTL